MFVFGKENIDARNCYLFPKDKKQRRFLLIFRGKMKSSPPEK